MAGGFLHKLLRRDASADPEARDALAELDRLIARRQSLVAPAQVLAAIIGGMDAQAAGLLTVTLEEPRAVPDEPLLRNATIALDEKGLRRRCLELCEVAGRQDAGAAEIARAVKQGALSVPEAARSILAGRADEVAEQADALGLDAGQWGLLLRLTLLPALAAGRGRLGTVREGLVWGQGYCPACGSWPLLAEYRGLEQNRWLRCGLCGDGWEFPRLACPFCGETDHRHLEYLHVEGEEGRHRAATCATCRGYVKTVSTLGLLSVPALLVADLATLHLDLAAADWGYAVPG